VACSSSTQCLAVGGIPGGKGAAVPLNPATGAISSGQSVQTSSGTVELSGVACSSSTQCKAVGSGDAVPLNPSTGEISSGQSVQAISGTVVLDGAACSSSTQCLAVGGVPEGKGVVVLLNSTTPTKAGKSPAKSKIPRGRSSGLALSANELANAKLPAGVCSSGVSGVPQSGSIQLSHGVGTVGTTYNPDFFGARIIGTPVHINLGGTKHAGVAVVIACGTGGSAQWTSMWVFGGSASHLKTLFGGVVPRSYAQGVAGSLMSGVSAKGSSLVVREVFSKPGDACEACATGRTTTTWSWSASNPGHLVITRPPPKKVVVVTGAAPSGFGGLPATLNQAEPPVVPGHTVLATCTAQATSDGSLWTELDSGGWLPSGDLQSVNLPNCDGGASSPTATAAPPATTTTTSPATTTTTAPPAQSTPCVFESSWSCESTDPTLTIDSYYSGDAGPGCTFTWSIDWGDGSPAQDVTQNGEPMGYYSLANYTYQSPSDTTTYTVTVSAVSVTGGCNIYTHVGTFTLIAQG
jgi:hypothetical protein